MSLQLHINHDGPVPVFQQVCDEVLEQIRTGRLLPGSRLPPVRRLATEIGVAANTVAKSYRQLETEGHVRTAGRNGTVVSDVAGDHDEVVTTTDAFVSVARRRDLTLDQAIGLLRRRWR